MAAKLGKKVAVLDYVEASPHGTSWGLGGTCVNVGCIPKKLMHHSAALGKSVIDELHAYGWNLGNIGKNDPAALREALPMPPHSDDGKGFSFDWESLVRSVQTHINSLNFGYKAALHKEGVDYINARGTLCSDPDIVLARYADGKEERIRTQNTLIAVGGRPKLLDIPGAHLCITSDDIFSLRRPPGKTLVVGGSYVSLECAGFLTHLGFDTTVMARSIYLRGFDQDMSREVVSQMGSNGTRFFTACRPTGIQRDQDGQRLLVNFTNPEGSEDTEDFDTVLLAVGREPCTLNLGLEERGITIHDKTRKIIVDEYERSSVEGVYAIGDVAYGRPELTPTAIAGGRALSRRLFGDETRPCDYKGVATTIFTPLEYSCIGLSEEEAVRDHGEENIEVYHSYFAPLESSMVQSMSGETADKGYVKCIVNKVDNLRVLGLHYTGPHAGEVMQGFAVAYKMGMTYSDLSETIGIHPTSAEEIPSVDITKASGESPEKTGC